MAAMDRIARARGKVADACREARTPAALLSAVQQALQRDVPADRWCALTLDPATSLPTGGVHEHGLSAHLAPRMLELEFACGDVNSLAELARAPQPVATLARATAGESDRSTSR
jgi:hypothetical protein